MFFYYCQLFVMKALNLIKIFPDVKFDNFLIDKFSKMSLDRTYKREREWAVYFMLLAVGKPTFFWHFRI